MIESQTSNIMDDCYVSCSHSSEKDPYGQVYASVMPRYCGSLSVIGSTCIIIIILQSGMRLSSTYHRIMFAMSITDIFASTAMALTSIPVPKHGKNENGVTVDFGFNDVPTYGNKATCEAQGFFFIFGTIATYSYNMSLCLFYVLTIVVMTKEEDIIKRKMGVALIAFPLFMSLVVAFPPLFLKMYNPSDGQLWCTISELISFSATEDGNDWCW